MSEQVDEVVLVDLKRPNREIKGNVGVVVQAIETVDESLGVFDHTIMSNVLEHLDDPFLGLRAAAERLAQNGQMHILSPNCETLNRRIGLLMGAIDSLREIPEKEKAIGHKHMMTIGDIKDMLKKADLSLMECRGVFLKPVPTPEMIEWPEERIKAYFDIAEQIPPELCHEVYFRAARTTDFH